MVHRSPSMTSAHCSHVTSTPCACDSAGGDPRDGQRMAEKQERECHRFGGPRLWRRTSQYSTCPACRGGGGGGGGAGGGGGGSGGESGESGEKQKGRECTGFEAGSSGADWGCGGDMLSKNTSNRESKALQAAGSAVQLRESASATGGGAGRTRAGTGFRRRRARGG